MKKKKTGTQKSSRPKKSQPVPKRPEGPHSKDKLLSAALTLFARHGLHGTTTKMIAHEAGVNEALIMRHFKTKLGLFLAVVVKEILPPSTLPYPAQASFFEEISCFADQLFDHMKKNTEILRILFGHSLLDSEFKGFIRSRIQPPQSQIFHDRLVLLQKKQKLSLRADLMAIQASIRDLTLTGFLFSILLGEFEEELARSNLRYFLRAFAAGIEVIEK